MARYRKIDVRTWGDAKFRALSRPAPNGQSLWFHLLTGPHTTNIPGLSRIGEAAMAEELDWPLEGFREAFREAFREGLVRADWKARVVWIPNAIKYDPPQSPNVVKSWADTWDEIPECALKTQAYQRLKGFVEGLGEGFGKAFGKAIGKTIANPEQEQEQEQDKRVGPSAAEPPASLAAGAAPPGNPSENERKKTLTARKPVCRGESEEALVAAVRQSVRPALRAVAKRETYMPPAGPLGDLVWWAVQFEHRCKTAFPLAAPKRSLADFKKARKGLEVADDVRELIALYFGHYAEDRFIAVERGFNTADFPGHLGAVVPLLAGVRRKARAQREEAVVCESVVVSFAVPEGASVVVEGDGTLWDQALMRLKDRPEIGIENYNVWLRPTRFLRLAGGVLEVATPSEYYRDWLMERSEIIEEALCDVCGDAST